MKVRHYVGAALACVASGIAGPAFAACQRGAVSYDMPAQRLDEAVQQLTRRSGCPVTVDPGLIADRRAPAIRGRYAPDQALALLVRNTGYTARATPEGLTFDDSVLAITMSQARALRTALQNRSHAGRIGAAKAARTRQTLTEVERTVPRQVNSQGMLTPAQKRDVIRKLDAIATAVGPITDARDWAAFKRSAA